jgi:hypothetical protein
MIAKEDRHLVIKAASDCASWYLNLENPTTKDAITFYALALSSLQCQVDNLKDEIKLMKN